MTAVNPAALLELAQGLTVPTIAEAETGTRVVDRKDGIWTALDDGWYSPGCEELSDDELEDLGVSVTHVPLPVERLAAVRAALEGAAAELEQARAERDAANAQAARAISARDEAIRIMSEQSFRHGRLDNAVPSLRVRLGQAMEFLRPGQTVRPPATFAESVAALLSATADLDLARTDPLRADAEGGESRD